MSYIAWIHLLMSLPSPRACIDFFRKSKSHEHLSNAFSMSSKPSSVSSSKLSTYSCTRYTWWMRSVICPKMQTMPNGHRRAGLRPGTPVPSAGQCRPSAGTPVPSAGLRPALPFPVPASAGLRPSAGTPNSVPLVQTSAGLASVSPMPRVTECTCRPVPHCRCRPSGLHQALDV